MNSFREKTLIWIENDLAEHLNDKQRINLEKGMYKMYHGEKRLFNGWVFSIFFGIFF